MIVALKSPTFTTKHIRLIYCKLKLKCFTFLLFVWFVIDFYCLVKPFSLILLILQLRQLQIAIQDLVIMRSDYVYHFYHCLVTETSKKCGYWKYCSPCDRYFKLFVGLVIGKCAAMANDASQGNNKKNQCGIIIDKWCPTKNY